MKKRKNGFLKVSSLVVMLLVIMAFARGQIQDWLMILVVSVWLIITFGITVLRQLYRFQRYIRTKATSFWVALYCFIISEIKAQPDPVQKKIYDIDLSEEPDKLTMNYVNQLITSNLQVYYPDSKWDWASKNPISLVKHCETGRICTSGTGEYNFADVAFNKIGGIHIMLLKCESLDSSDRGNRRKDKSYDVESWYTQKGQKMLSVVVKELRAKGHETLFIGKGGEVLFLNQEKQMKSGTYRIAGFPQKTYWKKLASLISDDCMTAAVEQDYVSVKW